MRKIKETKMNYYETLPEGYEEYYVIDAENKKTGVILNIIAIAIWLGFIVAALLIKRIDFGEIDFGLTYIFYLLGFFAVYFAYLILHELTHGLFYKIFTRRKLRFGFNLFVAFCGVPDIYVKKVPMIITTLAPFVIFTVIGLPLLFIIPDVKLFIVAAAVVGGHLGGCIGDLYVAFLLIFKFKGLDLLMNDTGPKQTFYLKK